MPIQLLDSGVNVISLHVIGLPPDVIQDLLEVTVPVVISCMLKVFIKEKKLFTLPLSQ